MDGEEVSDYPKKKDSAEAELAAGEAGQMGVAALPIRVGAPCLGTGDGPDDQRAGYGKGAEYPIVVRARRRESLRHLRMGTSSDWFKNVQANPRVVMQIGRQRFEAVAEVVGDEAGRERILGLFRGKYGRLVPVFYHMDLLAMVAFEVVEEG